MRQNRFLRDFLVIGALLTTILVILLRHSDDARFFFVASILVIFAALSGELIGDIWGKTGIDTGFDLYLFAGILITYLSDPWIGSASVIVSFFFIPLVKPAFKAIFRIERSLPRGMLAEATRDLFWFTFYQPNMWVYCLLLFLIPLFQNILPAFWLWNIISLLGSISDYLVRKMYPFDRAKNIGNAPWMRFAVYGILFSSIAPSVVSFVLEGRINF